MGTETDFTLFYYTFITKCSVKLNDPLMGTETRFSAILRLRAVLFIVKLNDPLMGTETMNCWNSYVVIANGYKLN